MDTSDFAHTAPIRLLIVDDHAIFRDGLLELIGHWDDFQVECVASNGLEAVALYREQLPDIVLMDTAMPMLNGAQATRLIRAQFPSARIVAMAISNDDPGLLEAIQAGACGYMLKDVSGQQLHILLKGWAVRDAHQSGCNLTGRADVINE